MNIIRANLEKITKVVCNEQNKLKSKVYSIQIGVVMLLMSKWMCLVQCCG